MIGLLVLISLVSIFITKLSSGWIGSLQGNSCHTTVCDLSDDTGYKFTNLDFSGTTGFDDLVDDSGGFTNGTDIIVGKLNVTNTIFNSGNITHPSNSTLGIFNNGSCIVIGDLKYISECS